MFLCCCCFNIFRLYAFFISIFRHKILFFSISDCERAGAKKKWMKNKINMLHTIFPPHPAMRANFEMKFFHNTQTGRVSERGQMKCISWNYAWWWIMFCRVPGDAQLMLPSHHPLDRRIKLSNLILLLPANDMMNRFPPEWLRVAQQTNAFRW